ncbi:MAG: L,D-transpeptidase family protein [Candidatus Sumerlaeia bacterium]
MRKFALVALCAIAGLLAVCAILWDPAALLERIKSRYGVKMNPPAQAVLNAARARLAPLLPPGAALPLPGARIEIDKQARRATLFSGDRRIKTYAIVLGGSPTGHKRAEGDGRTPEGDYRICTRNAQSRFHLFLGLNYPNTVDAQAAFKAGAISQDLSLALAAAESRQSPPNWKTPLGGEVGLHGGGTVRDWTAGCIAFDNSSIEEIWVATAYWTPVTIR